MLFLELSAGLVLLLLGGSLLVRGAVSVAYRAGLSSLAIGLTIVAFGTSMPELMTSIDAALSGSPGIAVGNVVGSNIANILLVLSFSALLYPVRIASGPFRRDSLLLLGSAVICVGVLLIGELGRLAGFFLVLLLVGYVSFLLFQETRGGVRMTAEQRAADREARRTADNLWVGLLALVGGIALMIFGARFIVRSSIELAAFAGVSETVVGLTIVALGTSLPELVTSFVAAIRRETDIAFGNVIGSNIFNVLGILGATVLVQPLTVPPEISGLDGWIMLAATVVLVVFAWTGWRLVRWEGAILLAAYLGYVGYLAVA